MYQTMYQTMYRTMYQLMYQTMYRTMYQLLYQTMYRTIRGAYKLCVISITSTISNGRPPPMHFAKTRILSP